MPGQRTRRATEYSSFVLVSQSENPGYRMRFHLRRGSVVNKLAVMLIAICYCRAQSAKSATVIGPNWQP
jgi:hypothetical protein